MVEEFDDIFEDDIIIYLLRTMVVIPEIPDAEGIHVVERTNNQLL